MATQAQKDAAQKRRADAERKKNAAQKILRTGKNADGTTASAAQRAAAIKRRDGHIKTMQSAEVTMTAATTEAVTATYDIASAARADAKAKAEYAKLIHGTGSDEHRAALDEVRTAGDAMTAQAAAANLSHDEAETERDRLVALTAGKSGQELFDLRTKIRAYGDRMRELTGRQKGEGTSYIGPGLRVALDAGGKIKRDSQGRVVYDVDTDAYRKRFIPKFTPTQEQIEMGQKLFPGVGITEGYLTPWQQVNIQWMTGSKNEKGELLSDLGITPTDENIGLFDSNLKEGIVPKAWRDAWRTEHWGDVKDPDTGLWTPATGQARQDAIAAQLERYNKGYFNPTTGKGGADEDAPSQWGPNTGLISPDDHIPPGWTGPLPAPGMGIGDAIQQTTYRQPSRQDWSAIMPSVNYSPQFEALTAGKGKFFQPWTRGQGTPPGLINYRIPGSPEADVTYTGAQPNLFNTSTNNTTSPTTTTDAQGNKWIMSNGNWYPADSDYALGLSGNTRLYPFNLYDSGGMYIGSESGEGNENYGSGEGFGAMERFFETDFGLDVDVGE